MRAVRMTSIALMFLLIPGIGTAQYLHLVIDSARSLCCRPISVPITLHADSGAPVIAGIDLLIGCNNEVLTEGTASIGDALIAQGWESFQAETYPGMPGLIRIRAQADTSSTPGAARANPEGIIAHLNFLISNDRTIACQTPGLRFCWQSPTDNTLQAAASSRLFIVSPDAGGIINNDGSQILCAPWDHAGYHASILCEAGTGLGTKTESRISFRNGQVRVLCPSEIGDPLVSPAPSTGGGPGK